MSSLSRNKSTPLLQSPLWGQVQRTVGRSVFYLGKCLIIKHSIRFGKSWFYSPRLDCKADNFSKLIDEASALAKKENAIFWKIELNQSSFKIKNLKFNKNYKLKIENSYPLQYPETFLIDLSRSEDEILKNMKQKTRYNIRLARKRGITVKWSSPCCNPDRAKRVEGSLLTNDTAFNTFYSLLTQTARRQKIKLHSKAHYQNIFEILGSANSATIITAYYNGKPIASNLITFYDDTVTYLHGGTSNEHRNLMAPYLLQWETIIKAKERGRKFYDLGGCAVTTGKTDAWSGITKFKSGFGGKPRQFGETFDVVFDKKWYWLYQKGIKAFSIIRSF